MKRRTRNYAKRQLTWMRRLQGIHEIDLTEGSASLAAGRIVRILAAQPGEAPAN
jgi:tRNA dimethylallyltransferase